MQADDCWAEDEGTIVRPTVCLLGLLLRRNCKSHSLVVRGDMLASESLPGHQIAQRPTGRAQAGQITGIKGAKGGSMGYHDLPKVGDALASNDTDKHARKFRSPPPGEKELFAEDRALVLGFR